MRVWTEQDEQIHRGGKRILLGMLYGAAGSFALGGVVSFDGIAWWASVVMLVLCGSLAVLSALLVTMGWWLKAAAGEPRE